MSSHLLSLQKEVSTPSTASSLLFDLRKPATPVTPSTPPASSPSVDLVPKFTPMHTQTAAAPSPVSVAPALPSAVPQQPPQQFQVTITQQALPLTPPPLLASPPSSPLQQRLDQLPVAQLPSVSSVPVSPQPSVNGNSIAKTNSVIPPTSVTSSNAPPQPSSIQLYELLAQERQLSADTYAAMIEVSPISPSISP